MGFVYSLKTDGHSMFLLFSGGSSGRVYVLGYYVPVEWTPDLLGQTRHIPEEYFIPLAVLLQCASQSVTDPGSSKTGLNNLNSNNNNKWIPGNFVFFLLFLTIYRKDPQESWHDNFWTKSGQTLNQKTTKTEPPSRFREAFSEGNVHHVGFCNPWSVGLDCELMWVVLGWETGLDVVEDQFLKTL